jgi:hypothetical protein
MSIGSSYLKEGKLFTRVILVKLPSSSGGVCYLTRPEVPYDKLIEENPSYQHSLLGFDTVSQAELQIRNLMSDLRYQAPEQFGATVEYMQGYLRRLEKAEVVIVHREMTNQEVLEEGDDDGDMIIVEDDPKVIALYQSLQ